MPRSLDERRAAGRKYYREHAEQIKAYQKRYSQENRERIRVRNRKYFQEHLEETRADRMARQREYRLKNPEYNRKKCHEYYVAHREKEIRRRVEDIRRGKQKLYEFKATLKCSRCGQSFPDCPAIIDFHHKGEDPKSRKINLLVGASGLASKRVQDELAKCIPLCANCHRVVHDIEQKKRPR